MTQHDKIKKAFNIQDEDQVCYNCKHIRYTISLGTGIICKLTKQQIPGFRKTCKAFSKKDNL